MKKLIFLSLFFLGTFVAVQAQVSYKIFNASGTTFVYTVTNAFGQQQSVTVPSNGNVPTSGTFADFIEVPFDYVAANNAGCNMVGNVPAPGSGANSCGASNLSYTLVQTSSAPPNAPTYSLVVKIN